MGKKATILRLTMAVLFSAALVLQIGSTVYAKGGPNKSEPVLRAEPTNAGDGAANYLITGSGFARDTPVWLIATSDQGFGQTLLIRSDANGSLALPWHFSEPAEYAIQACQYVKKRGGSWKCGLGIITFTVQ